MPKDDEKSMMSSATLRTKTRSTTLMNICSLEAEDTQKISHIEQNEVGAGVGADAGTVQ
jgi:hypothetical protein